jgi:hypothetical protein
MPKYTVEDLDPRNYENQIEKDIKDDSGIDSFAIQWTSPIKHLFAGLLNDDSTPNSKRNTNMGDYNFDTYWNEKMRHQRNKNNSVT